MLKSLLAALALATSLATPAAYAENAQQSRMASCNQQATGMKGDARKAFMSNCLAGKPAPAAKASPQQRMKDCNDKAAGMKGDARKAFMSKCLKG